MKRADVWNTMSKLLQLNVKMFDKPYIHEAVNLISSMWKQIQKMRNCENCKHKGQTWVCDWCSDRDRWEFDG